MSGALEIAFEMIESTLIAQADKELKIVGVYEANLITKPD